MKTILFRIFESITILIFEYKISDRRKFHRCADQILGTRKEIVARKCA